MQYSGQDMITSTSWEFGKRGVGVLKAETLHRSSTRMECSIFCKRFYFEANRVL